MTSPFKKQFPFDARLAESTTIRAKFPGRIPTIVERSVSSKTTVPLIDKQKFLVPGDLSISQFVYIIRRRMALSPETAIFLFVAGTLPTTTSLMKELYATYKDQDGFLYIQYSGESTFGMPDKYALFWGKNDGGIIGVYDDWNAALEAASKMSEKMLHPDGFAISMIRSTSKDQCYSRGYTTLYNMYSADSILLNTICVMPT